MSAFRKYPLFSAALTVCGLLVLGEGWCIYERWSASRDGAVTLAKKRSELQSMAGLVPPPTREVAKAVESDLARAEKALATMQAELKGRGPAAERMRSAKVPAARTDAYFDLATFVEKAREFAKAHDVEIRPEAARFGFSRYANEGPEVERIESVFHHRQIAQYLLEALLDAKPRALLAIQREPSLTKKEKEEHDAVQQAIASGAPPPEATAVNPLEGPDYFAIDPRASARVPGYLDATAFRFVFIGQTAALRSFINKLATFELPVLVREVEVEPATAVEAAEATAAEEATTVAAAATSTVLKAKPSAAVPKANAATPIVPKPWSRFTVTVEYIELVNAGSGETTAEAGKAST